MKELMIKIKRFFSDLLWKSKPFFRIVIGNKVKLSIALGKGDGWGDRELAIKLLFWFPDQMYIGLININLWSIGFEMSLNWD